MSSKNTSSTIITIGKKYYFILAVLFVLVLVGIIAVYKLFLSTPHYLYVKIKVGQPLWWAVSTKPMSWYTSAMNKGDISYDFLGRTESEILGKKMYLWSDTSEYDVYITAKVKVAKNFQNGTYTFNRSIISVGSPIEIQFPQENIKGTVIEMSQSPLKDTLTEKTMYLEKADAFLWEYDAVHIGATISDGTRQIFTVLDKSMSNTTDNKIDFTIMAKVKLKKENGIYILGEEKTIEPGRPLDISLSSYVLKDFIVSKIE